MVLKGDFSRTLSQAPSIGEKSSHREGSPALPCDDEDGEDGEDDGDGEDGDGDGGDGDVRHLRSPDLRIISCHLDCCQSLCQRHEG